MGSRASFISVTILLGLACSALAADKTNATVAVETNRVTLLFADGRRESLSLMSKAEVAEIIIAHVVALLE